MEKACLENGSSLTLRQRLRQLNGFLLFFMLYMACCAFNYGYDVGTFGGVQAMQSFTKEFGVYDERQELYVLPAWLSSVMTATPFLGKAMGCISAGWIAEKWGRRVGILCICIVSFVGVTLQVSATTAAQFTVGRVITFAQTGMIIVIAPIYQGETSPKALRGMFASTTQVMVVFGSFIATFVTLGTKHYPGRNGWQIPIGLQLVMPTIILAMLPFIPESPRWLLSQDRRADATKSLKSFRRGVSQEGIDLEIDAIKFANETEQKGPWSEVFDRKNRVRTAVAVLAMFGQQICGQAFTSNYGVVFYISQGFKSQAFVFNVISSVISLVAVFMTFCYVDQIGRRPVLLFGGVLMAISLYTLGGISTIKGQLDYSQKSAMVASIMLFNFFYNLSWAPVSFVVVSEVAAQRVKEKTNLLACVVSVLTTFVTSFTVPYLINKAFAGLGGKVGFIYGSTTLAMSIATYFFIPELKGRTLEEVDQLFSSGVALRKFGKVKTRTAEELYQDEMGEIGVMDGRLEKRVANEDSRGLNMSISEKGSSSCGL